MPGQKTILQIFGKPVKSMVTVTNLIEEPQLTRHHKAPRRIDDGTGVPFAPSSPQDFYRIKYYTIIDSVMVGLTDR